MGMKRLNLRVEVREEGEKRKERKGSERST